MDTIVAVSTSLASSAGINILRMSGEDALKLAQQVFSGKGFDRPQPNRMYLGEIKGENFSEKAFCVYYKAPKSYTGEDVTEFHCHGGRGVTNAIFRLLRMCGARPADAGEFTKRAFLNGKLTLLEAEGVLEMIGAESESDVKNAYRLMTGEVSKGITEIETRLIQTVALFEAKLDYPEELSEKVRTEGEAGIIDALRRTEEIIKNAALRKTVKNGADIAIIGSPNTGKSSLLNAILKQERAIVTSTAGTTRDVLSESMEYEGIRLNFLDTAGIRESADEIEQIGIGRSKATVSAADLILFVRDLSRQDGEEEGAIAALLDGKEVILIGNKCDIKTVEKEGLPLSAKTGENIDLLLREIMKRLHRDAIYTQGILTGERQIFAMNDCHNALKKAQQGINQMPDECVIADLKDALAALAKISGKDVTEAVVGEVFSRFCVGK